MTHSELARQIFGRSKDGFHCGMTVKQVNFYSNLWRAETKCPTTQTAMPVYDDQLPPLEVVVYPNGAGFVRVCQFATSYNHAEKKWEIKPEYAAT